MPTSLDGFNDKIEFSNVRWNDSDLFTLEFKNCPDPTITYNILNCCPLYDLEFSATACLPAQPIRYVLRDENDPSDPTNIIAAGADTTDRVIRIENYLQSGDHLEAGTYYLEVYFGGCEVVTEEIELEDFDLPEEFFEEEPLCLGDCPELTFDPGDFDYTYEWYQIIGGQRFLIENCLLYTSDAADE